MERDSDLKMLMMYLSGSERHEKPQRLVPSAPLDAASRAMANRNPGSILSQTWLL